MTIKIISQPVSVLGVEYVDVETKTGKHTMLKSRVDLLNALEVTGLNELGIKAIMSLVDAYAVDLQKESRID
jgi:hypothetical protein